MAFNEKSIQDVLYIHCAIKGHEMIVPNSCVFGWESDLISVNKSGFITEFEIKITRADFRADKITDWQRLQLGRSLTFKFWKQRLRLTDPIIEQADEADDAQPAGRIQSRNTWTGKGAE